ncbi:NirD/YgiW/YdeI family stress tolerance protein [Ochrobactrum soli]|uniref:NirD/YgiW/YdeI family stress tolerance protein n=1 Tax=Ochrobactrum soli TaxID=2448455 RepID=A0A849KEU0_9HYPH|nr:NirD/YgiW/YdeI family stress tolerance protein [[Ochrobactrum] soli]MCI1000432.1 NirD/YgiW/YdeI family stress tolerance protein [Ochrobactrum sp. C6C9]NNU60001.1 NirD/YgiW/YdeI family stress tolerance protein [[Ochrobactrum] soli]RLL74490.1 NirD/YgiW/YdeI family stress tolerance protein [[Ochrobactrum] soli]RRD26341.1 NirD/YgiW/YdeI family stress tolerance protein [Brucellaceae bacterium VT-16-1752]
MNSVKQRFHQLALLLSLFLLGSGSVSYAQFLDSVKAGNGITASVVSRTPIGTRVVLTGSIKGNMRRAHYIFQDQTGTTRVRIEREIWRGRKIGRKDQIEIRGRVDNDVRGRFIDVYYFKILK